MTPFFHWLPEPTKLWLVSHFQLGHWNKAVSIDDGVRIVQSARLLNKKMMEALFADASIMTETLFFFPNHSLPFGVKLALTSIKEIPHKFL